MNTISEGWDRANKKLMTISERDLKTLKFLDHKVIATTMRVPLKANTVLAERRANWIPKYFGPLDNISILEIGGGYGNTCRVIKERIHCDYTILDIEGMLRCAKAFLKHHKIPCEFVDSKDWETLIGRKFDLVVSFLCLPETPKEYEMAVLDKIFPNCDKCLILVTKHDLDLRKKLEKIYPKLVVTNRARNQNSYAGQK